MRLSLCMIALDAEATLGRCLDSVRAHVDEIVVVDTGSSDATAEVARSRGARVIPFTAETNPEAFALDEPGLGPAPHTGRPFLADFAAARNFSFSHATGDLVMWLDADDEMDGAEALPGAAEIAASAGGAWLRYEDGERAWWRERIVGRGTARWVCPVHEVLTPTVERRVPAPVVRHRGPGGAGIAWRNYKILLLALRRGKGDLDARLCYYLGREAAAAADRERARWAFERCIRNVGQGEQRIHARLEMAKLLRGDDSWDAFREYAAAAVEAPEMPHAWLGMAAVAHGRGDWQRCAEWTGKGLGLLGHEGALWGVPRDEVVVAWQMRNWALNNLGRVAEALEATERGLELAPQNEYLVQNRDAYRRHLGLAPAAVPAPTVAEGSLAAGRDRILLLVPSRGRPERALETVRSAMETAVDLDRVDAVVGVEPSDEAAYRAAFGKDADAVRVLRNGGSYVAAIRELAASGAADVYGLVADDFRFETSGWDREIRRVFWALPGRLGLVFGDDGLQGEHLATAPFLSREWIESVGNPLPGPYTHMWCDTEVDDVARRAGLRRFLARVRIRHDHWLRGAAMDEGYARVERTVAEGQRIFVSRAGERAEIASRLAAAAAAAPRLSVLIPTVGRRKEMLDALVAELTRQRAGLPVPSVEILVERDEGEASVGTKRNRLLDRARGLWVAFVDDDDAVAPDYLPALLGGIAEDPDCVTFRGLMTSDGAAGRHFEFRLAHREWGEAPDGTILRNPNHLCAVRASIAKAVAFPEINYWEDRRWAEAILPALRTERHVARSLYHYRWRSDDHREPPSAGAE